MFLLLLQALIRIGFAVPTAAGAHPALPDLRAVQWVVAGLASGCACALLLLIVLLRKRIRIAFFLTLGLPALLAVLTITDRAGLADWIYLILVAIPFILPVEDRGWYLSASGGGGKTPSGD